VTYPIYYRILKHHKAYVARRRRLEKTKNNKNT